MRLLITVAVMSLITAGCGENGSPAAQTQNVSEIITLTVTDTIGVFQGDINQIFGDICDASYASTGEVFILDRMNSTISIFTPQGEFISQMGGMGEAPWEFDWATSIAPMYSGWLLVSDYAGREIVVFDEEMEYSHTINDFQQTAPAMIQPCPDGTYIGRDMEMWQNDSGEIQGENIIRRWLTDSPEPLADLLSSPMLITMLDDGLDAKPASLVFAASSDGIIYCAISSDSLYQVFACDENGNPVFEINEPWERIPKTPEEIEAEGTVTAMQTDEDGATTPVRIEVEVNPFHDAISNLCCDNHGRLWVRLGSEAAPTFRVYNSEGEFQFTVTCSELEENGRQIRFRMTHGGIVAWDTTPEDYPKVYIIQQQ